MGVAVSGKKRALKYAWGYNTGLGKGNWNGFDLWKFHISGLSVTPILNLVSESRSYIWAAYSTSPLECPVGTWNSMDPQSHQLCFTHPASPSLSPCASRGSEWHTSIATQDIQWATIVHGASLSVAWSLLFWPPFQCTHPGRGYSWFSVLPSMLLYSIS